MAGLSGTAAVEVYFAGLEESRYTEVAVAGVEGLAVVLDLDSR